MWILNHMDDLGYLICVRQIERRHKSELTSNIIDPCNIQNNYPYPQSLKEGIISLISLEIIDC